MNSQIALIQNIDALLPQTQCGLCGHRDGCLPYAKSIAEGEEANKCVPGGQPVADALATLLKRPCSGCACTICFPGRSGCRAASSGIHFRRGSLSACHIPLPAVL